MFDLQPPRHISTLQRSVGAAQPRLWLLADEQRTPSPVRGNETLTGKGSDTR
jgi:hypothetical protein